MLFFQIVCVGYITNFHSSENGIFIFMRKSSSQMLMPAEIILQLLHTAGKRDWDTDNGLVRSCLPISQDKIACHLLLLLSFRICPYKSNTCCILHVLEDTNTQTYHSMPVRFRSSHQHALGSPRVEGVG